MPTVPGNVNVPTAAGILDLLLSDAGGPLGAANTTAQVTAAIAGAKSLANPTNVQANEDAIVAGLGALGTARLVYQKDVINGASTTVLATDLATELGDVAIITGGVVRNIPGSQEIGEVIGAIGDDLTIATIALNHGSSVIGLGKMLTQDGAVIASIESQIASNAANAIWTGLENALTAVTTAVESPTITTENNASTALNNLGNSLNDFVTSAGDAWTTLTSTVTSDAVSIANSVSGFVASGTAAIGSSSASLDTTGNTNQTATINSDGSITETTQGLNSGGSVTYTDTTTFVGGGITSNISGTGDISTLSDATIILGASTTAEIDGDDNAIHTHQAMQRCTPFTPRRIQQIVQEYRKEAGIAQHIHPHLFRHQMLTYLTGKGLSDAQIQLISGHQSKKSLEMYQHLSLDAVEGAYQEAVHSIAI